VTARQYARIVHAWIEGLCPLHPRQPPSCCFGWRMEDGIMPAAAKLRTTTRDDRGVIGRAGRIVRLCQSTVGADQRAQSRTRVRDSYLSRGRRGEWGGRLSSGDDIGAVSLATDPTSRLRPRLPRGDDSWSRRSRAQAKVLRCHGPRSHGPPQQARVRVRPANDERSRCCGVERHWRTGRNGGCDGRRSAAVIRPPTTITPVSQRRLRGRRHSD
jgi:hypothetical protein